MQWLIYPAFVVVIFFLAGIKVITEYQRAVVFRLGRLVGARGPVLSMFFLLLKEWYALRFGPLR
jgi:regulator of protease activity HflC (stomatin/prohibitin superfamily)